MSEHWVGRWKTQHDRDVTRLAWFRLNADGVFLALLAIGSAVFDLINPSGAISAVVDQDAAWWAGVYLRIAAYLLGGVLILWALTAAKIFPEIMGRAVLLGALAYQFWARGHELGFTSGHTMEALVIFCILFFTSYLRISTFFSKQGVTFVIPPRRNGEGP